MAIVIPCYRQAHFLSAAIDSAYCQSVAPAEVIVVDDGLDDQVAAVAQKYSKARLIRQHNRGPSGARNSGLHAAVAAKIIFLDSDDRLLPRAIANGLKCFRKNPAAGFVYGGSRQWIGASHEKAFTAVSSHRDLIRCNWIGCPATVMFDRNKLLELGGFDESLTMCEDWDLYLRLSRRFPFAAHSRMVADYVKHDASASTNVAEMGKWIQVVRKKEWERGLTAEDQLAWFEGEEMWRAALQPSPKRSAVGGPARRAARLAKRLLRL